MYEYKMTISLHFFLLNSLLRWTLDSRPGSIQSVCMENLMCFVQLILCLTVNKLKNPTFARTSVSVYMVHILSTVEMCVDLHERRKLGQGLSGFLRLQQVCALRRARKIAKC